MKTQRIYYNENIADNGKCVEIVKYHERKQSVFAREYSRERYLRRAYELDNAKLRKRNRQLQHKINVDRYEYRLRAVYSILIAVFAIIVFCFICCL